MRYKDYLIVGRCACVNVQIITLETTLENACLSGHVNGVRTLVGLGANSQLVSQLFGTTCLHWLFNFDPRKKEVAGLLVSDSTATVNANISPLSRGHHNDQGVISPKNPLKAPIVSEHFPFYWPIGAPLHWAVAARSWKGVYDLHMIVSNRQYRESDLPRCVWSWVDHGSPQNRLDQLKRCLQAAQMKRVETDLRRNNFEHRWLTLLVLAIHVPAWSSSEQVRTAMEQTI